jgi:multidrug efflux pump
MSFLLAFIGMQIFGLTINFITLFSLILVIGILIDSAIVVVEGIYDYTAEGMSYFDAASNTLKEFSKPIIAGVLTTISIFFPLMTLSGTLGQFIGGIPRVINIVLVVSVAVALIFIPLIASFVYKLPINEPESLIRNRKRIFEQVSSWYQKFITRLLYNSKLKRRIVYGLILLFISSFVLVGAGLIKSQFFPPDELDRVYVNIELAEGTPLLTTSRKITEVESLVAGQTHVDAFTTTIGQENIFVGPGRQGTHFASIIVNVDDKKNGQIVSENIRQVVKGIDEYRVQVLEPESGPPVGAPFQVKVSGNNWDDINVGAEQVASLVNSFPASRDVDSGVDTGVTDIQLQVQDDRLVEYGLTPFDLSSTLRTTIFGTEATTLQLGDAGATDVVVKVAIDPEAISHRESNHVTFDQIRNLPIQTPRGEVLLGYLVTERVTQATSTASHTNGEKTRTVNSYVEAGFLPVDIATDFDTQIESLELPEGVTYSLAGATDENDKAQSELIASLLFGMLLIFGVLIWQFGSIRDVLFIVSVIPLGLIGVLYGLFIFNMTLSFTAMLGFIALVGIVVNDSIILVDVMNKLRLRNPAMPKYEVVIKGATMRLRPVLLTTVTTVLGMVPLLFVSPLWEPFAFALIVGLTFATILTLVLVPILYAKWSQ